MGSQTKHKTKMKTLLLLGALCLTTLTAQAGYPAFRPHISCSHVGTTTKYMTALWGVQYPFVYDRFLIDTGVGSGKAYVDFFMRQNIPQSVMRNPQFNNLGQNLMRKINGQNLTYNEVLTYAGLPTVPSAFGGEDKESWYIETDNHPLFSWNAWLQNNTTECLGSNDNPTNCVMFNADGRIIGIFEINGWSTAPGETHPEHGYLRVDYFTGYACWNSPTSSPPSWSGNGLMHTNYWWNSVNVHDYTMFAGGTSGNLHLFK